MSVVILAYNEDKNIAQALTSVQGWANEVFVVDSFSTDQTELVARQFDCVFVQHKFENYAKQRNFAIDRLPIRSEWVLFLDADEWLPDALKREISALVARSPEENGFFIKWRLIWMGRWIRRGYYPTWILRLFRHGKARCEDRAVNEHLVVDGKTGRLREDFMHEDRKGVSDWIAKHNGYATREAVELFNSRDAAGYQEIDAKLFGTQAQRKRWLRYKVWNRMPPLIRPFFYFFYRYVLTGGFLEGMPAFIYHFLQALWYPLLIDIKYLEMKLFSSDATAGVKK
ncbi:glycosyltransferase family 2 protein [Azoarcus sp. KH32C]|uniref:glycosyltransferase family 2 protein n=1 Tax=Azoarcus sp. KH32C TaxID=748247 RepID=UPI0005A0BDC3|nr:glycosyltransferase family 2 protein [Azoarcus sp. KH32C]